MPQLDYQKEKGRTARAALGFEQPHGHGFIRQRTQRSDADETRDV
jgi:hypothetical protein